MSVLSDSNDSAASLLLLRSQPLRGGLLAPAPAKSRAGGIAAPCPGERAPRGLAVCSLLAAPGLSRPGFGATERPAASSPVAPRCSVGRSPRGRVGSECGANRPKAS